MNTQSQQDEALGREAAAEFYKPTSGMVSDQVRRNELASIILNAITKAKAQPTTTGEQEWTAERIELEYYAAGALHSVELATAINAALAAERENVILATQMVQIESKRANTTEHTLEAAYANHRRDMECTSNNYECELNAKLEQINQQAGTIKELSEALDFYCEQSDDGHRAVAALSKLGYPLPEGKK